MRIVLINPFPRFRNAEREYIERFARVAADQGHEAVRVTPEGRVMTAEGAILDETLDPSGVDFALALHHATAKQLDLFTYGVLWVPIRDDLPQYGENMRRMLSWDDRLSSDSRLINAYVANAAWGVGQKDPLNPLTATITCQRTDLRPRRLERPRLFYAGTNWDVGQNTTAGRGRIRHEALLRALDSSGRADFYGPRYDPHVDRTGWEGFQAYRGELPFDGVSTLAQIHEAGVCLALTSSRHRRDAVASVRVFEACAAGAVVIADRHPFFEEAFGDSLLYVDSDAPPEVLRDEVFACLDALERDPDAGLARAEAAQRIFHKRFTLDAFVRDLCAQHPARREALRRPRATTPYAMLRPEAGMRGGTLDACAAAAGADVEILCLAPPGTRLTREGLDDLVGLLEAESLDAVAPPRPQMLGTDAERRADFDFAVPPEHFEWSSLLAEWAPGLVFRRELLARLPVEMKAWGGDLAGAVIQASRAGRGFRVAPWVVRLPGPAVGRAESRRWGGGRLTPFAAEAPRRPDLTETAPLTTIRRDGNEVAALAALAKVRAGTVWLAAGTAASPPTLEPGLAGAWRGEDLLLRRAALGDYPIEALHAAGRAWAPALDAVLRRAGPVAGSPPATAGLDPWEAAFLADVARPQAGPLTRRRGLLGRAAAWANMPHRRDHPAIRLARRLWGAAVRRLPNLAPTAGSGPG